jgi:phosphatidylinositol alpha-1,6-mannosyltransferase
MARIIILTRNFPPMVGGMENLLEDIYGYLTPRHNVSVIAPGDPRREDDPRVTRITGRSVAWFLLRSFFTTLGLALQKKPHLIISGSLLVSPVAVAAGVLTGAKRITVCHGLDVIFPNPLYQLVLKATFKLNTALVANSGNTKKILTGKGYPDDLITIINPGVSERYLKILNDKKAETPGKRQFDWEGKPAILSAGRLTERKGVLPFLRRSFVDILRQVPDCMFVVVGDDPVDALAHSTGELSKIKTAVEELKLSGNVRFYGYLNDHELVNIYGAVQLLVFPLVEVPGDIEGFGMVAIEAAAAGTPTVAMDCGGVSDAVVHGETGILITPGDYESFNQAVIELLGDDSKRLAMGERARQTAMSRFTSQALAAKWNEFVESLVKQQQV